MQRPNVASDNPWLEDKLDRKEFGLLVAETLSKLTAPATVALIGPWGSGKSTFLAMLRAEIDKRDAHPVVISFDAWAEDYAEEPLAAFIAAFHGALKEQARTRGSESLTNFRKTGARIAAAGLANILRIAKPLAGPIVAATTGIEGGVASAAVDATADVTLGKIADALQTATEKVPEDREEFRKHLTKLAQDLSADKKEQEEFWNVRILVLIDELDRCRPDFAIRLLEVIKHFFDVPHVAFVLAYDEPYLTSACKSLYGQSFDAERYLRRFIDMRFWLPDVSRKVLVDHIVNTYQISDVAPKRQGSDVVDFVQGLLEALPLSARDMEQAAAICRLFLSKFGGKEFTVIFPCLFFCAYRFCNPELVGEIITGKRKFADVLADVKRLELNNELSRVGGWLWTSALIKHADAEKLPQLQGPAAESTMESRAISSAVNTLARFPYGPGHWRPYLRMIR
jgi:hypothetical protein